MSTELIVAILGVLGVTLAAFMNGVVALLISNNTREVRQGTRETVATKAVIEKQAPEIEKIHQAVNSSATAAQDKIDALQKRLDERQEADTKALLEEVRGLRALLSTKTVEPSAAAAAIGDVAIDLKITKAGETHPAPESPEEKP